MTKKDYELAAKLLAEVGKESDFIVELFFCIRFFRKDSEKFNQVKFVQRIMELRESPSEQELITGHLLQCQTDLSND